MRKGQAGGNSYQTSAAAEWPKVCEGGNVFQQFRSDSQLCINLTVIAIERSATLIAFKHGPLIWTPGFYKLNSVLK